MGKNSRLLRRIRPRASCGPKPTRPNLPWQTDLTVVNQIEQLLQDLTDKYVVVDSRVPELRRFEGHVGQVKTVNMSGRALVQFDAWNNIGWYDIDPGYLKVVPKPDPATADQKQEAKKPAAKKEGGSAAAKPAATGEKKLSPLEMARMQGAAKTAATRPAGEKPAAGDKQSTADILAAARAGTAAAAPKAPSSAPTTAPAGKMNTADILAAARAKKSVEATAATEEAPAAPAPAAKKAPAAPAPTLAPGVRPSVSEILAWCRQHDSK